MITIGGVRIIGFVTIGGTLASSGNFQDVTDIGNVTTNKIAIAGAVIADGVTGADDLVIGDGTAVGRGATIVTGPTDTGRLAFSNGTTFSAIDYDQNINTMIFLVEGAEEMKLTGGSLFPVTALGLDLGGDVLGWKNAHIQHGFISHSSVDVLTVGDASSAIDTEELVTVLEPASGTNTLTLPAATTGLKYFVEVQNTAAGAVDLATTGGDTINGVASPLTLLPNSFYYVTAESASDWRVRCITDGTGTAFDIRDNVIWDHFVTSTTTTQRIGKHGWSELSQGTGSDIAFSSEVGHPGIIDMGAGTTASGRVAIYMGDGAGVNFSLGTTQNTLSKEWLIKFNANTVSVSPINAERVTIGYGDKFDALAGVEHDDGVYIEFDPSVSTALRLVTANGGTRTKNSGSTAISANTWYRAGIEITYPGGTPTAQLLLNGGSEVSGQTANFPTVGIGVGYRLDAAATVASEPRILGDYVRVDQVTAKED